MTSCLMPVFAARRPCLHHTALSRFLHQLQARYDNVGDFAGATDADRLVTFNSYTIAQNGNGLPVRVVLTAKKTMKAPVCPADTRSSLA